MQPDLSTITEALDIPLALAGTPTVEDLQRQPIYTDFNIRESADLRRNGFQHHAGRQDVQHHHRVRKYLTIDGIATDRNLILAVTISNVMDVATNTNGNCTLQVGVLDGDVNGDGVVNAYDATAESAYVTAGSMVGPQNARADVDLSGALDSSDVSYVEDTHRTGNYIPAFNGPGVSVPSGAPVQIVLFDSDSNPFATMTWIDDASGLTGNAGGGWIGSVGVNGDLFLLQHGTATVDLWERYSYPVGSWFSTSWSRSESSADWTSSTFLADLETAIGNDTANITLRSSVAPYVSSQIAKSTMDYDNQGRVFRSTMYSVNPNSGAVSATGIESDAWFDHDDNAIETHSSGGAFYKTVYDGADRPIINYTTDGGAVALSHPDMSWSAANSVGNDIVLAQTQTVYDNNGNVIETITKDRDHDVGNVTGALAGAALAGQPPAGFPSTFTIPASSSPTHSALTLTWISDIALGDGSVYGGGYTSNTSLSFDDFPTSGIAVWIVPSQTALNLGFTGNYWAFWVADSSMNELFGEYTTVSTTPISFGGAINTDGDASWSDIETITTSQTGVANARVSYVSYYYDAANRQTDTDNLGTFGGETYARPSSEPPGGLPYAVVLSVNTAVNDIFNGRSFTLTWNGTDNAWEWQSGSYSLKLGTGGSGLTIVDPTAGAAFGRSSNTFFETVELSSKSSVLTDVIGDLATYGMTIGGYGAGDLRTSTFYNDAGDVDYTVDPRGIETKYYYDALGQTLFSVSVEWSVRSDDRDGRPSPSGTPTDNQTTAYTYDGNGNVITMTAVMPTGTNNQVTQYVFGVTGAIASNDLLQKVEYPDPLTGAASATYAVTYTYNALGQVFSKLDQNGTTHTYTYDDLGRQILDSVSIAGENPYMLDTSVLAIGTTYNSQGLVDTVTSYNTPTPDLETSDPSEIVNWVKNIYNGLGQLVQQYQEPSNATLSNSTMSVQYTYSSPDTGSRLTSMTYPSGQVIYYNYGALAASTTQLVGWTTSAKPTRR